MMEASGEWLERGMAWKRNGLKEEWHWTRRRQKKRRVIETECRRN